MPYNNQLTAMDLPDPADLALKYDSLDKAQLQNRLLHMQYNDLMQDRKVANLLSQMPAFQGPPSWQDMYGGKFDPQTGQPIQSMSPGVGTVVSPQQWEAQQQSQFVPIQNRLAQIQQQNPELGTAVARRGIEEATRTQALIKADLDEIAKIGVISPEAAVQVYNNNPRLTQLSGGPIAISGTGNVREIKDASGKTVAISYRGPDGKWSRPRPVTEGGREPQGVDAAYLDGMKAKIRERHPDWSPKQIEFEAAKAIREENFEKSKQKIDFTVKVREAAKAVDEERKELRGFKGWAQDEKDNQFWTTIITGKDPKFSWGDRDSYTRFGRERNRFEIDHGITPAMKSRIQTDYRSLDRSTANQRKIYDMMVGFAGNLDKQIDRVKEIYSKLPRTQLRLLNIPIVELRRRAGGSGEEASAASYLIEISNEIGKLSTGSAASIRELSESAQARWNKVHDGSMSVQDMIKILDTTKEQAKMRIDTTKMAMDYTRQAIETLPTSTTGAQPFDIKLPPGVTAEGIAAELRKRGIR